MSYSTTLTPMKKLLLTVALLSTIALALWVMGNILSADEPSAIGAESTRTAAARGGRETSAPMKVPLIYCSDIFHPAMDPDDHFDLAAVFAFDEFDIKALVLDGHIDREGRRPDSAFPDVQNHGPISTSGRQSECQAGQSSRDFAGRRSAVSGRDRVDAARSGRV